MSPARLTGRLPPNSRGYLGMPFGRTDERANGRTDGETRDGMGEISGMANLGQNTAFGTAQTQMPKNCSYCSGRKRCAQTERQYISQTSRKGPGGTSKT